MSRKTDDDVDIVAAALRALDAIVAIVLFLYSLWLGFNGEWPKATYMLVLSLAMGQLTRIERNTE